MHQIFNEYEFRKCILQLPYKKYNLSPPPQPYKNMSFKKLAKRAVDEPNKKRTAKSELPQYFERPVPLYYQMTSLRQILY